MIDTCHFCGREPGAPARVVDVVLTRVVATEATGFYGNQVTSEKVTYEHATISVPRCEKCFGIHQGGPGLLFAVAGTFAGLIGGAALGWVWAHDDGTPVLGSLIFAVLGAVLGTLLGLLSGGVVGLLLVDAIYARARGVKSLASARAYGPVRAQVAEGWSADPGTGLP